MEHRLDRTRFNHRWELDTEPTLEIASGDVVEFDLEMAGAEQIHEGDRYEDTTFDFDTIYRLLGPVFVAGARAGDTLRVVVLELTPGEGGWCGTEPDLGLLPGDFTQGFVKTFDLRDGRTARMGMDATKAADFEAQPLVIDEASIERAKRLLAVRGDRPSAS